jgi:transposase
MGIMVSLIARKKPQGVYYYAITCERVDGKPRHTKSIYLGTAEKIIERLLEKDKTVIRTKSYQYGRLGAVLRADRDLGFRESLNKHLTIERKRTSSIPDLFLAQIIGRSEHVFSRRGLHDWLPKSMTRLFLDIPEVPSIQCLLKHMDLLTDEVMDAVELDIARRLIALGMTPEFLFWDTTNVFTRIDCGGVLPRKGNSKDRRYDRNLIGLGLVASSTNIPLLHTTYPGNKNDSSVFKGIIDALTKRLSTLQLDASKLVAVFDRGNNSPEAVEALLERKLHLVGCLKRKQAKEYFRIPRSSFRKIGETSSGYPLSAYRTKGTHYGQEWTILVTYNRETAKKQRRRHGEYFAKADAKLTALQAKILNTDRRGRPYTVEGAIKAALKAIPLKIQSLIALTINELEPGKIALSYRKKKCAIKERKRSFGKQVIFTDLHDWTDEKIAQTNTNRALLEDDFKWLKDVLLIPIKPVNVRKDGRIKAHVFLCVMGVVLYRYLLWKFHNQVSSIKDLVRRLDDIRMAFVQKNNDKKAELVVEEMDDDAKAIYGALRLTEFLPKSVN